MRFFESYYFATVVQGIVEKPSDYLYGLHDWAGDDRSTNLVVPFPKWSHYHAFIEYVISTVIQERSEEGFHTKDFRGNLTRLWIDLAFEYHGFKDFGFGQYLKDSGVTRDQADEDHVYDYFNEMAIAGPLEELTEQITKEVFFITFSNRELLRNFNDVASTYVADLVESDIAADESTTNLLARDGVLKRCAIPVWSRNAVFFRDRGRCASCNCDLSGIVSLQSEDHFDHIIPLAQGGLNDVSNLQLLCAGCNLGKGSKAIEVSRHYEEWY